jgi:hypothetical protein
MRRKSNLFSAHYAENMLDYAENISHNLRIICGDKRMYIWEQDSWPALRWDDEKLSRVLARVSREQGRLLGKWKDSALRCAAAHCDAHRGCREIKRD